MTQLIEKDVTYGKVASLGPIYSNEVADLQIVEGSSIQATVGGPTLHTNCRISSES